MSQETQGGDPSMEVEAIVKGFEVNQLMLADDHVKQKGFPDRLWHYAPTQAIISIFGSRELWLTQSKSLNDPKEYEYGIRLFAELIRFYTDRKHHWHPTLREMLNNISDIEYFYIAESQRLFVEIVSQFDFFCFSLCSQSDDLFLWRLYADDAKGMCLGIPTQTIIDHFCPPVHQLGSPVMYDFSRHELTDPFLSYVRYGRIEFERSLFFCTDNAIQLLIRLRESLSIIDCRRIATGFATVTARLAAYLSSVAKHECYKGENEWRIVQFFEKTDTRITCLERPGRMRSLHYIKIPFSSEIDLEFGLSIIRGPRCDDRTDFDVIRIPGGVAVAKSELPYCG